MTHLHSKTPLAIILKEELKQAGLDIGRTSRILAKKKADGRRPRRSRSTGKRANKI